MKQKSASQPAPKPSWKNAILLTVAALALCASPTIALAAECLAETSWTDTTGSWFVAANWFNNQPPTSTIGAQINNGGTAQVGGPGAAACDLTVGYNATDSGRVSVDTGSLVVGQEAEIGAFGKGTLTITRWRWRDRSLERHEWRHSERSECLRVPFRNVNRQWNH